MKKLFLLFALVSLLAIACETNGINDPTNDNPIEKPESLFFEISEASFDVGAQGGEITTIVFSNNEWEISGKYDWCRPEIYNGSAKPDGVSVRFTIDPTDEKRNAIFWFRSQDKQIKFTINQQQIDTIESKSDNYFEITDDGGIVKIQYASNVKCDIIIPEDAIDWVSIDETRTLNDESYTLFISKNEGYIERCAKVKIVSIENTSLVEEYIIKQLAAPMPSIDVDISKLNFSGEGGSAIVHITCNTEWEIDMELPDWLVVSSFEGVGDSSISVTALNNDTNEDRDTKIVVYALHKYKGRCEKRDIAILQTKSMSNSVVNIVNNGYYLASDLEKLPGWEFLSDEVYQGKMILPIKLDIVGEYNAFQSSIFDWTSRGDIYSDEQYKDHLEYKISKYGTMKNDKFFHILNNNSYYEIVALVEDKKGISSNVDKLCITTSMAGASAISDEVSYWWNDSTYDEITYANCTEVSGSAYSNNSFVITMESYEVILTLDFNSGTEPNNKIIPEGTYYMSNIDNGFNFNRDNCYLSIYGSVISILDATMTVKHIKGGYEIIIDLITINQQIVKVNYQGPISAIAYMGNPITNPA